MILSAAMMCRYGLGLEGVAARLEGAVTAGTRGAAHLVLAVPAVLPALPVLRQRCSAKRFLTDPASPSAHRLSHLPSLQPWTPATARATSCSRAASRCACRLLLLFSRAAAGRGGSAAVLRCGSGKALTDRILITHVTLPQIPRAGGLQGDGRGCAQAAHGHVGQGVSRAERIALLGRLHSCGRSRRRGSAPPRSPAVRRPPSPPLFLGTMNPPELPHCRRAVVCESYTLTGSCCGWGRPEKGARRRAVAGAGARAGACSLACARAVICTSPLSHVQQRLQARGRRLMTPHCPAGLAAATQTALIHSAALPVPPAPLSTLQLALLCTISQVAGGQAARRRQTGRALQLLAAPDPLAAHADPRVAESTGKGTARHSAGPSSRPLAVSRRSVAAGARRSSGARCFLLPHLLGRRRRGRRGSSRAVLVQRQHGECSQML